LGVWKACPFQGSLLACSSLTVIAVNSHSSGMCNAEKNALSVLQSWLPQLHTRWESGRATGLADPRVDLRP